MAIRFNLAAREAVEKAVNKEKVATVATSDNLRWTLSGGTSAADNKPLGKAPAVAGADK